jgi:DNA mismatch repair protein MutS
MKHTPMLQQYLELKARHQDALLLYRLGDFYELFFEDAERAAPVLGIVLTKRRHNDEVTSPMCGIPHHALTSYVGKLLEAGFRVAVAEQVEDPAKAGGLVRREVIRVLTSGTVTEPELLADGERRWIAAALARGTEIAVAYLEAASGEFGGASFATMAGARELLRQLRPRELLVPEGAPPAIEIPADEPESAAITPRPAGWFDPRRAEEILRATLAVASLRAFELEPGEALVGAAGSLLEYVRSTQGAAPRHVSAFVRRRDRAEVFLDAATIRNLEILRDSSGERRSSLASVLDHTVTPMGSRLLRDWLVRPLAGGERAAARHAAVAELADDPAGLATLRDRLTGIGDLERVAARLGLAQARPGELVGVRAALAVLPELRERLMASGSQLLATVGGEVDVLEDLAADVGAVLADDPPALVGPGMIRPGADGDLDESRRLAHGAKEVLAELESRERLRSGISNLRVRYSRVFGYAFEVSKSQLDRVPTEWVRRQTLATGERFTTLELEDLERQISAAEASANARESELYDALLQRCAGRSARLAATARLLATVDVLAAFAERARRKDYVRPVLVDGARVRLRGARHPVIEEIGRAPFVPNDVDLDGSSRQIVILTGPNMGGKSTYLRQAALAVIMARAGSFVAAEEAEIGAVDRVFTRVGAADDLARGESTFMVEMTEAANILLKATPSSLVILDEVGRGTATFDGLSLAWAIVEALHGGGQDGAGPLVLFATHYHELTDLAQRLERVVNASVAVKEWQGQVIFLHRVVPGPSDRSYGIHVARLAGVPEAVCRRAAEVLGSLERQELRVLEETASGDAPKQLSLFPSREEAVTERLRRLEIDALTPLDALNLLAALCREVSE